MIPKSLKTDREDYLYAAGVFGDDTYPGRHGSGYAVLEVARSNLQRKEVVLWQRYYGLGHRQTSFRVQSASTPFDPNEAATAHLCPIPVERFTAETAGEFDAAHQASEPQGGRMKESVVLVPGVGL